MAEELTQDQLDNMSEEELTEYEKSLESEEPEEKDTESSDEDTEKLEEAMDETESTEEKSEEVEETQEPEEESSDEDKRFEGKTKEEVEKSYHELEQLQKRQANELGDKRKEAERIADLEQKIEELSKPKTEEPVQEKFDPEKYSNLLIDNPALAEEYKWKLDTLPKLEAREAEKQEAVDAALAEKTQQDNLDKTVEAFDEFFKLDEFKDISQEDANKFGAFIREKIQPPKSGYFTSKDIQEAYGWFNPEKAILSAKKKVLDTVSDAAPKVKVISSASGAKVKSTSMPEGLNAQEQADWAEANMTKEEMDKALDEAE